MTHIAALDPLFPIEQQLQVTAGPVVLLNIFTVSEEEIPAVMAAWEDDANWLKRQPGFISTQLHRAIGGSNVLMNYAVWDSVELFRAAFTHPEFLEKGNAYPPSAVAKPHLFSRVAVPNLCTA